MCVPVDENVYDWVLTLHIFSIPKGELKESMAELEESRRKLINQKMQKIRASGVQVPPVPVLGVANGLCLLKSLQIRLSG